MRRSERLVLLAVAAMLLVVPGSAAAGGDEERAAPPSAGPPGPWDGTSRPRARERPAETRRCGVAGIGRAGAGAGSVLGVFVERGRCRAGRALVRAYQSCVGGRRGRACSAQTARRCVQPEFLGRCRTYARFYRRTVKRYTCVERRMYEIRGRYDADVSCRRGRARISYTYTLFRGTSVVVGRETELRAAWANPRFTQIELNRDIVLRACRLGDPIRESSRAIRLDGRGHTLRQGCFEKRLLRQDGTGFVELANVTLTRGGSDGPGAAITSRGEIRVVDSRIHQNLAEEPGGGVMSQRRATIVRSVITGNLANDDGGGVYARRGGIRVYDSVVSGNLVDGSGGALGSTGDILVVRSHIDGNTTDGDGGAIYADEDGDVTVIDSTVNGSTADGPGGGIFTLDGDVTIVGSTVNGNRADDRGGAISGEADVTVINSTIARNAAVAHVGGGVWARGNLYVANSTVSGNYAEGQGGGLLAAGVVTLAYSTVADNVAPVGADVGAGERVDAFGSIVGPARTRVTGGHAQATGQSCQAPSMRSLGYNAVHDPSCSLRGPGDHVGGLPRLGALSLNGGLGETSAPLPGSPALDRVPPASCARAPLPPPLEGARHVESPLALLAKDARGVRRPQGAGCDAGAVEVAE